MTSALALGICSSAMWYDHLRQQHSGAHLAHGERAFEARVGAVEQGFFGHSDLLY